MREENILIGEQRLTEEQKMFVHRVYNEYDIYSQEDRPWHDKARVARKVYHLDDPGQDLPGTKEIERTLQLQTLKSTLMNCLADQLDNMPEAIMAPERPNLEGVAEDMTDVVRFILDQNDYEDLHGKRAEDFFVTGTTITQVMWDPDMNDGEGNVALVRWPVEAFLWDPVAEDIQEARSLMKISWRPVSWFRDHYDAGKYVHGETKSPTDVGAKEAQTKHSADEEQAMLVEYWWRTYDRKSRKYQIHTAHLASQVLLYEKRDVYKHGLYPFVVKAFDRVEGVPVGEGLVEMLTPMMRYINRYAHYIDENLRMSSKNRMLVRRGANIDVAALCDWQKNLIEGDRISPEDIQWFQSKPLSGMAPQQMLQFQTDMKQDSGQNQFTRGETAGGITAASAISALQEAGGKITRMRTALLNQSFKELIEQVMWLVSQFYGKREKRLITGKDGKPREVDMTASHLMGGKKGDFPAPPYHVQIQISRRNPLRVQAQNELFIQAYTMAAQAGQTFPLSMLFELLQVDGKDRIMPLLYQLDQTQQLLNQAQMAQQEAEQLKAENASLQQVIAAQGKSLRSGMYPEATQTDAVLPDVGAVTS